MLPLLVFFLFVVITDLYTFKGLKTLWSGSFSPLAKLFFKTLYWLIPLILLASIAYVLYLRPVEPAPRIFNGYYYIVAFFIMVYFPKLVFILFHLTEDIVMFTERSVKALSGYLRNKTTTPFGEIKVTRRKFLSRIGIIVALIPFLAVIYGMAIGRFDFQVTHKTIESGNLPASFDGFRIVHISDLHIGSFYGYEERVRQAVEIINGQKPDVIVFTGDLVNRFTSEIDGFIDILAGMESDFSKYSVLGNHDYGDYYQWESELAKEENMQDMLLAHENIGFRLLINESETISVNGETIAIIGVENWGNPPFPRYGDLEKSLSGTDSIPFLILLTHDPSHWDAEVLGLTGVDLTLSGHTHGMQFGIENRFIRWSPSKIKYPRWGGLFEEQGQYLYVNRGLGFTAFPGRIGMPPEITVIELIRPI